MQVIHDDQVEASLLVLQAARQYARAVTAVVSVADDGGSSVPAAGRLDLMAEGGRGLAMVAACTTRWGFCEAYPGRTVWAEASWPVAVPSPRTGSI